MGNWFGKKKKESHVTEQDLAVLKLKKERDQLKQYAKRMQNSLIKDKAEAREVIQKGNKERAKLILRKKRYKEQVIDRAYNQIDNLERLVTDIEQAQMEADIVKSLDTGNKALKQLHEDMPLEEVQRVMDDVADSVEKQQEIDDILSGSLTEQDEEDIINELDQLLAQDTATATPSVPAVGAGDARLPDLPDVPENQLDPTAEKSRKRQDRPAEQLLAS